MFQLMPLPFAATALEPMMSARTLCFHHEKHHASYVNKLNSLIEDTSYDDCTLDEVVLATAGQDDARDIFNNAAQVWNHEFFWRSLTPGGGGAPGGELGAALRKTFGSEEEFAAAFTAEAVRHFGSGWAWLIFSANGSANGLEIVSTHDAETPLARGAWPLFCCDLWEHAYYLDYQNERGSYVTAFLSALVNWPFAATRFEKARTMAGS